MSKKSYKKLQNRLYREIKARMIAEKKLSMSVLPGWTARETRHIDTLKISRSHTELAGVSSNGYIECEKETIARAFGERLMEDGYINFHTEYLEEHFEDQPVAYSEVRIDATLDVVKPREGICWDEL